ncbi:MULTISPECIES: cytidine deaminase family protein [Providencia]|uniref:cytidine deaminase family protein n=1 Tax=Providencia TaxID=586 RepID=UPI0004F7BB22|nr:MULTISPECIES: cytidine deaminase [Providencia]AIN65126.1 cytidine and deoxycytidylate deaminase zinc-binding region family protein [Providencia stuartii]EMF0915995.1 cytidine deaminase [Providencia stuartii]MBG5897876.1 cytidine deaminase [Providencia stuartii]MBK1421621.1 cytidine deaminase [Providencia stuartii]MCR4078336.1 cytidine deaminase [Providencia stuartii]
MKHLIKIASRYAKPSIINDYIECGYVAAALEAEDGEIYTGISIDTACSLGFCAEHGAVAELLKAGKSVIKSMVAVDSAGNVVPPCGRCRELVSQLSNKNKQTLVGVDNETQVTLEQLMPYDWKATQNREQ